jgi:uncharacterized RDD family membrane protein YckC
MGKITTNSRAGRWGRGAGAFLLADLITGLAAYSVITLGSLWLFSYMWVRIAAEASARGIPFSSPIQLDLAWLGIFVTLPLAACTVYLATKAYGVPRDVIRTGGQESLRQLRASLAPARSRPSFSR